MSEEEATSGKYWLSSIKPGIPLFALCNMTTEDVDECTVSPPFCHVNAQCSNNIGSYNCTCNTGYIGNGKTCTDVDECTVSPPFCHVNAQCSNNIGSYNCTCNTGFIGNGKTCTDFFTATTNGRKGRFGVVQRFSAPRSGRYRIKAWGARGGTHSSDYAERPGTFYGGKGAFKEGVFALTQGSALNIVVGQRGGDSVEVNGSQSTNKTAAELGWSVEDNAGTGGGGGSFVYTSNNVLLLAAAGGGGASNGYNGVDGQTGTKGTKSKGKSSFESRSGGSGGQPGQCNNAAGASYHGGVGAGWLSQGCSRAGVRHGERGGSRAQGWVGGKAGKMNSGYNGGPPPGAVGGFGGGGGGSEDNGASGGGGGYSGGGSGTHSFQAGGGGGSYCGGSSCWGLSGGNLNDDGMVQIIELSD
ncbi:loricrin-like isoform X2 [Acropora muricata]|uniref:loricrin-like isoform X2 n=1 Tax=Acropora muricata TaxID=159855 RepID=UPI0034E4AF4F